MQKSNFHKNLKLEKISLKMTIFLSAHNFCKYYFSLNIFVDNVTISGLSTFVVDRARLSLIGPTIAVNLTIPTVIVDGYYNISGMLGNTFELHGSGPFAATARDFRIFFETVLGYSRGMYMKSFDLDFSIRDVKIRLDNFMGHSKFSSVMNEVRNVFICS